MIAPTEELTHVTVVMAQTVMIFIMYLIIVHFGLLCAEDFMDQELEQVSYDETDVDINLDSEDETDEDCKPYAGLILPDFANKYKEYSDFDSDTRSVVVLRVMRSVEAISLVRSPIWSDL